ncbi:FHA domain-containing protein [Lysobacter sp. A421]
MDALRLQFPNRDRDDLVLSQGVHAIGRGVDGQPCLVEHPDQAAVQFCVDRRGVWLQLRESAQGLHVNGRPVRRMAMLRAGDAVHMDGVELTLLGRQPEPLPVDPTTSASAARHTVLRGVGGIHHGCCFTLDAPCTVGRQAGSDVHIGEPGIAEQHARLEPHRDGIVLRDLGSSDGNVVNGYRVREGLLQPGDQIVFGANHRFVLEAPLSAARATGSPDVEVEVADAAAADQPKRSPVASSLRRLPWLLSAAALLAGALALLLLYGAR